MLHDASESYISDLTRPVKKNLPAYFDIEDKLQKVVFDRFGLGDISDSELKLIAEVDDALLYYEFDVLMGVKLFDTVPQINMQHDFSQKDFASVEKDFFSLFNELIKEVGNKKPAKKALTF